MQFEMSAWKHVSVLLGNYPEIDEALDISYPHSPPWTKQLLVKTLPTLNNRGH